MESCSLNVAIIAIKIIAAKSKRATVFMRNAKPRRNPEKRYPNFLLLRYEIFF